MKLTDEQKKQVLAKFNAWKRPVPGCIVCGHQGWAVSDTIFELREFHGGSMVFGATTIYPVIPLTCANCAHTVLLNAIMLGLVNANPDVVEEQKK